MKTSAFKVAAIILLVISAEALAADQFRLETKMYVFRSRDLQKIEFPESATARGPHHVVVGSPSVVQFGRETLSLQGERFSWNGGDAPPREFELITSPVAIFRPGIPVTLVSASAVEYLERAADGSLQVRQIPKDSSDAPHYQLTFVIQDVEEIGMKCEVDVATLSSREPVPGLTLNVGKPVLARFHEAFDARVNDGEWSAILLQAPNQGDFRLLLLIKVKGEAGKSGGLMSADELDRFVSYYYRNPRPDLVGLAIESLGPTKFLDDPSRAYVCTSFFAAIFSRHPDRIDEWREVIERRGPDKAIRSRLRKSLALAEGGSIRSEKANDSGLTELYWGRFFATGSTDELHHLIGLLHLIDDTQTPLFGLGASAMVSLAYFAPDHGLVRETLEAAKAEADLRTRELIDELLTKEPSAIFADVRERSRTARVVALGLPRPPREGPVWPGPWTGPRGSGDFSPVNPHLEMGIRTQR